MIRRFDGGDIIDLIERIRSVDFCDAVAYAEQFNGLISNPAVSSIAANRGRLMPPTGETEMRSFSTAQLKNVRSFASVRLA